VIFRHDYRLVWRIVQTTLTKKVTAPCSCTLYTIYTNKISMLFHLRNESHGCTVFPIDIYIPTSSKTLTRPAVHSNYAYTRAMNYLQVVFPSMPQKYLAVHEAFALYPSTEIAWLKQHMKNGNLKLFCQFQLLGQSISEDYDGATYLYISNVLFVGGVSKNSKRE
jgi:hypothetical protein